MRRRDFFAIFGVGVAAATAAPLIAAPAVAAPVELVEPPVSAKPVELPEWFEAHLVDVTSHSSPSPWADLICAGYTVYFRDGHSEFFSMGDIEGRGRNAKRWREIGDAWRSRWEAKRN